MHEMTLAGGIRDLVESVARDHGNATVAVVRLRIGQLAPVEVEALRFCFDVVMKNGPAANALLEIERSPGQARCWDCGATVEIDALALPCPLCGIGRLEITGGTDMAVREVELNVTRASGAGETAEAASCA
jgi:hydrogenase nickel incorporation protein HypA/HybF